KEPIMSKIVYWAILVSISLPLAAQDHQPLESLNEQPQRTFQLGAAALWLQKPYKGVDTDCYGLPFLFYQDQKLTIFGPMASYSFFGKENHWALQGLTRIRTEGYDNDDSRYLDGMSDRDLTLELGLRYLTDLDFAVLSMDFSHDVLDKHRGYEFRLTLRKMFQNIMGIESLNLTPSAGINWRSKQLNDYYYGVRPSEVIAGRPEYHAGSSLGWLSGLQLDYKLSEKWSLFSMVNVEWLSSEIADSPIVEGDYSVSLLFGALFEF
ncbi:MAG TPA: MipA/OmpV family protein, partial [Anaerohalosphaeraceae bacterium]|nr:MipA/OmpV family protein [Anaerohalosphaeraceae bacterium]